MSAAAGRPPGSGGDVTAGIKNGQLVNQRIRALVGQALDELERRRASGRSDIVKKIADEVEKGGIAALRSLQELLPKDDVTGKVQPAMTMQALFVQAAREVGQLDRERRDAVTPMASLLELTANVEPEHAAEPPRAARRSDEIDW